MDALAKFKESNPNALNQHFVIDPHFLENPSNSGSLRLVFVTASPVLTNEVRKFYNDLKKHVTYELIQRREAKVLKTKLKEEEKVNQEQISVLEDESVEIIDDDDPDQ